MTMELIAIFGMSITMLAAMGVMFQSLRSQQTTSLNM